MKEYIYHYSYKYDSKNVKFYGDGIAIMDNKINKDNYDELKKSIFNQIENKEVIGDSRRIHIISLSKL